MEVYLVQRDVGEYEHREVNSIAIYDSYEKATDFLISIGFQLHEDGSGFYRQHSRVIGECCKHKDYANIIKFEMNKVSEELEWITKHYK